MTHRMKRDPIFAKRVMKELKNFYEDEKAREGANTARVTSHQRNRILDGHNGIDEAGKYSIFAQINMKLMPMTPEANDE